METEDGVELDRLELEFQAVGCKPPDVGAGK